MADYNFIIDPDNGSGTDYTNIATFESNEQTTIGSGDRYLVECRCTGGTEDNTSIGCHIDGWTINGELKIYTTSTYRHQGVYPTSGNIYRVSHSNSWMDVFRVNEDNVTFDGIAAKANATYGGNPFSSATNDNTKILNCYGHGANYIDRSFNVTVSTSGYTQTLVNNIAFEGTYGFACGGVSGGIQYIYNNTAVDCSDDLFRVYSCTSYLFNNIAQKRAQGGGSGQHYDAYGVVVNDNNCSETSSYNTSVTNARIDGTVTFENITTGDLRLSSSDTIVRGRGVDLSDDPYFPFNYDYTGNTRSNGTWDWDLGAHQKTNSAPSEDINIIDPSNGAGTDYTSIASWESTEQGNLTACSGNKIAVAECRGGQDDYSVNVTLDGWTTNSVSRVIIRNHASEPPNGYFDTNRYHLEFTTYDKMLRTDTMRHLTIKGIQIINNTNAQSANAQYCIFHYGTATTSGSLDYHIVNNVIVNNETANGSKAVYFRDDSFGARSRFVFIGNMFLTNEDGLEIEYQNINQSHTPKFYFLNNTITGDDIGLMLDAYMTSTRIKSTQWIRNNIIYVANGANPFYPVETTQNYFKDDDDYNDYNKDNDSDTAHVARGSHGGYSSTFDFVYKDGTDESLWDVRLNATDTVAKGNGENLNDAVADFPQYILDYLERDITNKKRPPSGSPVAWDIGAHQVTPLPSGYHLMV